MRHLHFIDDISTDLVAPFSVAQSSNARTILIKGETPIIRQMLVLLRDSPQRFSSPITCLLDNPDIPSDACPAWIRHRQVSNLTNIDTVFLYFQDPEKLSRELINLRSRQDILVIAPKTDHFYANRQVFVNSIPKSGTHMVFELLKAFGYSEPESYELPRYDTLLKAGHFYNLQHMTPEYISPPYPMISPFIDHLCSSPIIFIFRDPRDIAVSFAHYFTAQPEYHILHEHFKRLSPTERITAVISGKYPVPVFLNHSYCFQGTIRDLIMRYQNWVNYPLPNFLPIRFEDLVGPEGGGKLDRQLSAIWTLQLALHIPGKPETFRDAVFTPNTPTFRAGQVGSHKSNFELAHREAFNQLPDDFMRTFGYIGDRSDGPPLFLNVGQYFRGFIPLDELMIRKSYLIESDYSGYNLILYRRQYYALLRSFGPVNLEQDMNHYALMNEGVLITASSLRNLKRAIRTMKQKSNLGKPAVQLNK